MKLTDDIQIGDRIEVNGKLCVIVRVLPTQIKVRHPENYFRHYYRRNGKQVGGTNVAGIPTKERVRQIEQEERERAARVEKERQRVKREQRERERSPEWKRSVEITEFRTDWEWPSAWYQTFNLEQLDKIWAMIQESAQAAKNRS